MVVGLLMAAGAAASPVALASVDASGGSGTYVDTDGTQGDMVPAVQGSTDDDGDQAAVLRPAQVAQPQTIAGSGG